MSTTSSTSTIDLDHGTVRYRVAGPERSDSPPVVFVHGFLVNGSLWTETADALAAAGVRSYAPDLPLGSHSIPIHADADQSPRGLARQVAAFVAGLGLDDVTLVGNDTGGAICQLVLDTDPSRIGRLVLTNCDAFEVFPPPPFGLMIKSFRSTAVIRATMAPMRSTAARHSPAGYGLLVNRPLDEDQTWGWVEPCLTDAGVRHDVSRFARAFDAGQLLDAAARLGQFEGPVLLVWGTGDRFFKLKLAHRLQAAFDDARLVEVEGGRAFLPVDEPQRVASEIEAFLPAAV